MKKKSSWLVISFIALSLVVAGCTGGNSDKATSADKKEKMGGSKSKKKVC